MKTIKAVFRLRTNRLTAKEITKLLESNLYIKFNSLPIVSLKKEFQHRKELYKITLHFNFSDLEYLSKAEEIIKYLKQLSQTQSIANHLVSSYVQTIKKEVQIYVH